MAKRRANGEGSIRRRRNGRWEVQIMDGYKPDGRRNMRSFSRKTQKEEKEKRDEYLRKRAAGLLTGREIRFDEWADIWFRYYRIITRKSPEIVRFQDFLVEISRIEPLLFVCLKDSQSGRRMLDEKYGKLEKDRLSR